jgi:TRAP-type C4-dicarboxylate transport system substrate-binding protein
MRFRKKIFLFSIFIALLLVIAGCGSNSEKTQGETNKEPIKLKLAVIQGEEHPLTKEHYRPFMERVTELTDEQVQFEFYPSNQLGEGTDLLDLTANGVADIAVYNINYFPSEMKIGSSLASLPGLYESSYQGSMAWHEMNKKGLVLEQDFLKNGVRPVSTLLLPSYQFFTDEKKLTVPEDFKGLQVRSTGGLFNSTLQEIGATPISLAVSEVFEAMDRGIIDVIHFNASSIISNGLNELVNYGTKDLHFGGAGMGLMINEDLFQKLPNNVKEAIIQAGDEVSERGANYYDEAEKTAYEELKKQGVEIHELTVEEQAVWQKFFDKFVENWFVKQKNEALQETYDLYLEEAKKFNK